MNIDHKGWTSIKREELGELRDKAAKWDRVKTLANDSCDGCPYDNGPYCDYEDSCPFIGVVEALEGEGEKNG